MPWHDQPPSGGEFLFICLLIAASILGAVVIVQASGG